MIDWDDLPVVDLIVYVLVGSVAIAALGVGAALIWGVWA